MPGRLLGGGFVGQVFCSVNEPFWVFTMTTCVVKQNECESILLTLCKPYLHMKVGVLYHTVGTSMIRTF